MIKLLVVDDEPGICDILKKTFSPIGFTVLTANSGKDGLALAKKENPQIVFLDVKMLGMSGLEVLKEIKGFDKSIKVIMITVLDDAETRLQAEKLGADHFITKPFNSEELERIGLKEVEILRKPKIMVVDDEEDVAISLSNSVSRRFNCEVEKALSGEEALSKMKEKNFDLVITDIKMPGLSGVDIMKEAKKFSPQTKFLAISAYDSHEIAQEALKAGAVDFIPKPHTTQTMELKVKQILIQLGKYTPK